MSGPTRLRWWFEDAQGQVVLAQSPNLPAGAATFFYTVARLPLGVPVKTVAATCGHVATVVWAGDEVLRGATPARRVTGGITALVLASKLARRR